MADNWSAYAQKKGIPYELTLPNARHQVPKAYADNFKFSKLKG